MSNQHDDVSKARCSVQLHVRGNADLQLNLQVPAFTCRIANALQLPQVITVAAPGIADGGFIYYAFDDTPKGNPASSM
jgi:hypothetical protein